MGRPRTPTAVLDARGAFKKDPQRKRDGEPVVEESIGAVPTRLAGTEVVAWQEIVSTAPMGVLTKADRVHVEEMSRLLAESWEEGRDFQLGRRSLLNKMLGQIGMNPVDRSKIVVAKPKDANPFDDF